MLHRKNLTGNIVQESSYRETIEQAQTAARQENYALLNQCLQELLLESDKALRTALLADSARRSCLLDLALTVLEAGSFHDRWDVAKILSNFGADAVDALIDLLNDEDSELQWFIVRILGSFDHPGVVDALIEVLKTTDQEELSAMAVSVLSTISADRHSEVIAKLSALLKNDSTRLLAVQTLGQIRRSQTVPLLLQVVNDADSQVRSIAIEALSSFHSPEITSVLAAAVQDLAVPVRCSAAAGLGFRHPQDCEHVDRVASLRPLLLDLNLDVCRQSAIALGRIGTQDAIAALSDVLQSPHTPEPLAVELVRALSWSNSLQGLTALQSALMQSTLAQSAKLEILHCLGRPDRADLKPYATEILLQALREPSEFLESAAARQALPPAFAKQIALSLGQLGDSKALIPLINLLSDPDVGVRLHVISALKSLDAEAAYRSLKQLAATENSALGREAAMSPKLHGVLIALQEWDF